MTKENSENGGQDKRSAAKSRKQIKDFFSALVVFLLAWTIWCFAPASVHYRVEEYYPFLAKEEAGDVRLAVMLPTSGPYQAVKNRTVSWDGTHSQESHGSVDVVKFSGRIEGKQRKVATIAYDVVLKPGKTRWQAPVEEFQIQPQEGIESDHPIIRKEASRIADDQDRDSVYRIFRFTAAHISKPSHAVSIGGSDPNVRIQSALKAYNTRSGVCGQYANLMTALCRSAGIPAQSVSGLAIRPYPPLWSASPGPWRHPAGSHAWVEFHTADGWEMADPIRTSHAILFKSRWFGKDNGSHLCYGERFFVRAVSGEMRDWATGEGKLVAGMTGPFRFSAGADAPGISVKPQATIKTIWDGRWFNLLVFVVLVVALGLYKSWKSRRSIRFSNS